jgi:replicative DNA helicase
MSTLNIPQSLHAEKVVLGCLMMDGITAMQQCQRLREEMFSLDSNRKIFRVLSKLVEDGAAVDYILVAEALKKMGALDSIGGMAYLMELGSDLPRHFNPTAHVETIIEKWKLRTGINICDRYSSQFADEAPSDETLSLMQADVFDALQELADRDDPHVAAYTVRELNDVLDYEVTAMGLSYGHAALDDFTMGLKPGQVTVVGARSGVGKSSLMIQAAHANARTGVPVDVFSLEMKRHDVLCRLWALESGLPYRTIQRKLLNLSERRVLREAALRVAEWPLRIHDDGELTLGQIAALARLSARRHGMRLFCCDYAQIVNAEGKDERTKVSAVSRTLTKLAKTENVHLMLLSQLRKVPAEQYGKPPHIGDLRETGQLENDCHTAVLLHRGWDEDCSRVSFDAELIVPKQRNGATGAIKAKFDKDLLIFK